MLAIALRDMIENLQAGFAALPRGRYGTYKSFRSFWCKFIEENDEKYNQKKIFFFGCNLFKNLFFNKIFKQILVITLN